MPSIGPLVLLLLSGPATAPATSHPRETPAASQPATRTGADVPARPPSVRELYEAAAAKYAAEELPQHRRGPLFYDLCFRAKWYGGKLAHREPLLQRLGEPDLYRGPREKPTHVAYFYDPPRPGKRAVAYVEFAPDGSLKSIGHNDAESNNYARWLRWSTGTPVTTDPPTNHGVPPE
jgi:hypothetical protein